MVSCGSIREGHRFPQDCRTSNEREGASNLEDTPVTSSLPEVVDIVTFTTCVPGSPLARDTFVAQLAK